MFERFCRWILFGVLIALIPIIFHYICLYFDDARPSIAKVIAHGELLIISVGMTSTAIGELLGWKGGKTIYKIIIGGACVILLIFSSLLFSHIAGNSGDISVDKIEFTSLGLYLSSIVSSTAGILVSTKEPL